MPTFTIGSGKDYDTASGIVDALAAEQPADFSLESESYEFVIYPDYDYTRPAARGIVLNSLNATPSKRIIIRAADGFEHKGVFGAGVILSSIGAGYNNNTGFFEIESDYVEIKNMQGTFDAVNPVNLVSSVNGNTDTLIENCLVYWQNVNFTVNLYATLFIGVGTTAKINNMIAFNSSVSTLRKRIITMTADPVIELNNCLIYNGDIGYEMANSFSVLNNCGGIAISDGGTAGRFANSTNCTGAGNYDNLGAGNETPGSDFLRGTLAQFGFIDAPNENFKLLRSSSLIGSGSNVTAENPKSIDLLEWNGNHRSPFYNIVIKNAFVHAPRNFTKVTPQYSQGLVFCEVGTAQLTPPRGNVKDFSQTFGGPTFSAGRAGPQKIYADSRDFIRYYEYDLTGSKYLTSSHLLNIPTSAGSTSNIFANAFALPTFYLELNPSTDEIILYSTAGSFTATADISTLQKDACFSLTLVCDFTQSTDAERVQMFTTQKGSVSKKSLVFSGTAPTAVPTYQNTVLVDVEDTARAITSMWNRKFNSHEIQKIARDPYALFRPTLDIDFLIAAGVIEGANQIRSASYNLNKNPAFIGVGPAARVINV